MKKERRLSGKSKGYLITFTEPGLCYIAVSQARLAFHTSGWKPQFHSRSIRMGAAKHGYLLIIRGEMVTAPSCGDEKREDTSGGVRTV